MTAIEAAWTLLTAPFPAFLLVLIVSATAYVSWIERHRP